MPWLPARRPQLTAGQFAFPEHMQNLPPNAPTRSYLDDAGSATRDNDYVPAAIVTSVREIPEPEDPYELRPR